VARNVSVDALELASPTETYRIRVTCGRFPLSDAVAGRFTGSIRTGLSNSWTDWEMTKPP
jgi:hypothetical protein